MAKERILSGVKHIYLTPWSADGSTVSDDDKIELLDIVGDSTSITQDDPETNTIECETRDEPIRETVTIGKYNISMDSANISFDILDKCFGFTVSEDAFAAAPTSYKEKFAKIEVELDGTKFILPRVLIRSKINAESLKTDICKGTVTGTAYSATVKVGSADAVDTPMIVVSALEGGSYPTVTVTKLS